MASAMGVVGTWTGEAHSERDPVGEYVTGYYLYIVGAFCSSDRSLLAMEGG